MSLEKKLIEGEDYYFDDSGLMVLTGAYLSKRGFCCHQGCRHCPYTPTIRSFVAIPLPEAVKEQIADWMKPLRLQAPDIRWVRPESLHLTIKFLGSVKEERFEREFFPEFSQSLVSKPLSLTLDHQGQFPHQGSPKILWLGLSGEVDLLQGLAAKTEKFFEGHGFAPENRPFAPHITIARIKEKPSIDFMKLWADTLPLTVHFVADSLAFYSSEAGVGGSIYQIIKEFKIS